MDIFTAHFNKNLEYTFACKGYNKILDLPDQYEIEGRKIHEIPHKISEYAHLMEEQNNSAMQENKTVSGLTIELFNADFKAMYSKAEPIILNEEKEIACKVTIYEIPFYSIKHFFLGIPPLHLIFQPPSNIFTEDEYQVLFLLMGDFSRKEITNLLNISLTTVNHRISCCLDKTACVNAKQLIEYCYNIGIQQYIPKIFREKGHRVLC